MLAVNGGLGADSEGKKYAIKAENNNNNKKLNHCVKLEW